MIQRIEHIPTPPAVNGTSFCHANSHLDVPNMQGPSSRHLASILPLTPSLAPNLLDND